MTALYQTAMKVAAAAILALTMQGCASTAPADPARAERNEAGQAALQGMDNAVLIDNDSNSPWVKPPPK